MTVIRPNSVSGINSITVQSGAALAVHKADGTLIQTIVGATGVSTFSSISVGTATTDNSAAKSINIGIGASIAQHDDNTLTFGTSGDPQITIDASGDLTIPQNIIHSGDTDTTIGFPAANNISLKTAGTERLFISGSGFVTIGTQTEGHSNADDLTIATSGNTGITIRSGTSNGGNIFFSDATSGTGEYAGMISYDHNDNIMTFATTDGTERLRITSTGDINVSTAATIKANGNATFSGIVTATTYHGDGSNLSNITSTTINSNADNRVITGSDTANTLNGESNVNIASGILIAGHTASTTVSNGEGPFIQVKSTDSRGGISLLRHSADAASGGIYIGKSRNGTIGSNTVVQDDDELGRITFSGDDGTDIHTIAAEIRAHVDGTPGSNDMPGRLVFLTTADGAAASTERLNIDSSGNVTLPVDNQKLRLGASQDVQIFHDGTHSYMQAFNTGNLYVGANHSANLILVTANTGRWSLSSSGHLIPEANDTYDIGTTSNRVRDIYTGDLNLSNEGNKNDVDGTWGSYTIQEGKNDLFLINKRSGKKYTFNLTEVV